MTTDYNKPLPYQPVEPLPFEPDNSRARRKAQRRALRDLKWLLSHTDLRIGQIVSNTTRGGGSNTFFITDEAICDELKAYRAEVKSR